MDFAKQILSRLSSWAINIVVVSVICGAGALLYSAISGERNVKFWPPEIGPGPKTKLIEEYTRLNTELDKQMSTILDQRKILSENLQAARANIAVAKSKISLSEAYAWENNAGKIEKEIDNIDSQLVKKINETKSEIRAATDALK